MHFITLEGGEGAGKSTQARLLAAALREAGHAVLLTREPGGAPGAERLRALLLSGEIDWPARAETLLHFAAREEHLARTIVPALGAGSWVVCDRFYDSTMAYQGFGQGVDYGLIAGLTRALPRHPDLTIMLDLPPAAAAGRLVRRGDVPDRYERMGGAFHARVAAGFRTIAAAEPARCALLAADAPEAAVAAAVWRLVAERLPAAG